MGTSLTETRFILPIIKLNSGCMHLANFVKQVQDVAR